MNLPWRPGSGEVVSAAMFGARQPGLSEEPGSTRSEDVDEQQRNRSDHSENKRLTPKLSRDA